MSSPKPNYVIVGGVAGGASTAARLRRNNENCNIIMFERGQYVSFANCGLPYYVGNVVKDESKLLVANPVMFKNRFDIDVRVNSTVTQINRKEKTISIQDTANNRMSTIYLIIFLQIQSVSIYNHVHSTHNMYRRL